MTTAQLKSEIHKAIDNASETVLPEILNFINFIQVKSPDSTALKVYIDKVFQEDDKLLRRLAE